MSEGSESRRRIAWWKWPVLALAVVLGATVLSTMALLYCAPATPPAAERWRPPVRPVDSAAAVRTEMRQVRYHVDPDIVLQVRYLRGELIAETSGRIPVFEDGTTYRTRIASAEIFVDTVSLALLMNRRVFGYRGAPIRDLHLAVEESLLVQDGKLGALPFTIRSTVTLTQAGEIRLHPVDVKVLGINADGLMDRLGLELEEMVRVQGGRGIRIEGNDFLLDVAAVLPPPLIEGTLAGVRLVPGGMVQRFGPFDSLLPRRFFGDTALVESYMTYRGSRITFGKLTMMGTDLTIVDADPKDWFGFYLGRYHEQLVAGTHRTTPEDGLVVYMPDLDDMKQ